jgi:hypothetical protein
MILDVVRFNQAIANFDDLNRQDPTMEEAEGKAYPKEFLYSERMSNMLKRYASNASEALQLAARCQHVQRWKSARASYPMTKAGYYQWRTELKAFHADTARQVLLEVGYDQATIDRVCALVMKALPSGDTEAQILEDVIVLVFLESYLEQFVASHADYDAAKFADILHKTLRKTSANARSAAQTMIVLPAALRPMVVSLLLQFETIAPSL